MHKNITADTKISMNDREKRVWKSTVAGMLAKVDVEEFANDLYEQLLPQKEALCTMEEGKRFFDTVEAMRLHKERGFE